MPTTFYRKKTIGQPDSFYEQGTNRYIGATEFGSGKGFTEVPGVAPANNPVEPTTPTETNPVLEFIKQQNTSARTQFENNLKNRPEAPKMGSIYETALAETGAPALGTARTRVGQQVNKLNEYLQTLEDDLLKAQKDREGMGRGLTTGLVRGQQQKLAENEAMARLPATRELQALTGQQSLLEQQYRDALSQAGTVAGYRYQDELQPTKDYEARQAFEAGLGKNLSDAELEILKTKSPNPTASIQEYEYAKQQGYKGSYIDFTTKAPGGGSTPIPSAPGTTQPSQKELNAMLTGYPSDFKTYINSIAGKIGFNLNRSSIEQQYQQFTDLKSKGMLPGGRTGPITTAQASVDAKLLQQKIASASGYAAQLALYNQILNDPDVPSEIKRYLKEPAKREL